MTVGAIGVVFRKELKDTLRDRRTLISMVVAPLVLMPVLVFGMASAALYFAERAAKEKTSLMILGGAASPKTVQALRAEGAFEIVPPAEDFARRISEKELRVAVRLPDDFDAQLESGSTPVVNIYHHAGEMKSSIGVQAVSLFFQKIRDETLRRRLEERSLPETFLAPLEIRPENVAPPEKVTGATLGGILAYMSIIFCLTGAMYPAMDLAAGEKERGTIETLVTSPVTRGSIVLGKFLTVLLASLVTAVLSFLSLGSSMALLGRTGRMGQQLAAQLSIKIAPSALAAVALMVLPLAVLFSAALLAISIFAKSYKEAQSYVSPLMLVAVLPAAFANLPGVELGARTALVPILSTALVTREMVGGNYPWGYVALIFISSCGYAALAMRAAVEMFRREQVLFRV
jgi:sodium transport system permease protein